MFRRSLLLFAILAISFPLYPQEETPAPDASEKEESNLIKTGTVVSASATSEKRRFLLHTETRKTAPPAGLK